MMGGERNLAEYRQLIEQLVTENGEDLGDIRDALLDSPIMDLSDADGIGYLRKLLDDESPVVRRGAAIALGKIEPRDLLEEVAKRAPAMAAESRSA